MKKRFIIYLSVLTILISINFISSFDLSPSQQTEIRVFVSNGTENPPSTENGGGSSGGGGDSGGKQTSSLETIFQGELCAPSWECDEWGECINLQKSRVCIDENDCFDPPKKIETGMCIKEIIETREIVTGIPIGFFLLSLILILIIILILLRKKKNKKLRRK